MTYTYAQTLIIVAIIRHVSYETLGLDHGCIIIFFLLPTNRYILPVKPFCYSLQRTCGMYKWPRLALWATTAHAVTIIVLGSTMKVHICSLP